MAYKKFKSNKNKYTKITRFVAPTVAKPKPRLPWLHKKRYYIPLYVIALTAIVMLLALPLLPQIQSIAQDITKNNSTLAAVAPPTFKPPDVDVPTDGSWLIIPKAGVKLPIVEGQDLSVLNKQVGVWHQTGTTKNNYVIAGHRLQYHRTVNQSLYHLDRMIVGDAGIYVVLNGKPQRYKVVETKVVDKYSIQILDPTVKPRLTIYTCNDFFNQRRLTVIAVPI